MSFGRWEPLDAAIAPKGAGCFQVRGEPLVDYPTGKSAMVYYGADDAELAPAVARLRAALSNGERAGLSIRFAPPETSRAPSETLARLLDRFRDRFGAPPCFNR